tara:strand:- start:1243 stop:2025 length:783 start_codon:yes stop_codon:yes gene_type:complete
MNTITVGTENNGYYNILKESCKKNNIKLNNIGYKKKWTGFTMRYELLYDYLNKIDDDTIILFIDAYDVIILKDKSEIINKFKKFKKNIVFGNQTGFFTNLTFYNCNNYIYNAGSYIGYAKYIKKFIKILLKDSNLITKFNNDDQQLLNYHCNCNKTFFEKNTICDINNDIFYITSADTYFDLNYLIFGKLNIPKNTCILHLAGSIDGTNYLKKIGYDITKVNSINYIFKLKQAIYINKKISFIIFLFILLIIYIIFKLVN